MEKIAFVYSSKDSAWQSCQVITPNILSYYKEAFNDSHLESFFFNEKDNKFNIQKVANEIYEFNPTKIVFVDHRPHPVELVKVLDRVYKSKVPELVFHVFGCFTLYFKQWKQLRDILKRTKVRFVVGSHRQKDLLEKFFVDGEKFIDICPFGVNENKFFFRPEERSELREKLGIKEDEFVFLYTGRLSLQKNIQELLHCYANLKKETPTKTKLIVAGSFDDLGYPFFGKRYPEGFYFNYIMGILEEFSSDVRNSIQMVGSIPPEKLSDYYNAADSFVSPSLHNDEDFGMSPAEAIMCGLPSVLTSWGGYYSFYKYCNDLDLVNVYNENGFYYFKREELVDLMKSSIEKGHSLEVRQRVSENAKASLSIKSCSEKITEIHKRESLIFKDFNPIYDEVEKIFELRPDSPYIERVGSSNEDTLVNLVRDEFKATDLYRRVYDSYTQ